MGLIRYWQPPTESEQLSNGVALVSGMAVMFYFFFLFLSEGFWSKLIFGSLWLFSILLVIVTIQQIIKNGESVGIDIALVGLIFLVGSILLHIFLTYFYWVSYEKPFFLDFLGVKILILSLALSIFYYFKEAQKEYKLVHSIMMFIILNIMFGALTFFGVPFTILLLFVFIAFLIDKFKKKKKQFRNEKFKTSKSSKKGMECPECGMKLHRKDKYCPKCGQRSKKWYKRWWAITLFIIIGLGIIGNLTEEPQTTDLEPTTQPIIKQQEKQEAEVETPEQDCPDFSSLSDRVWCEDERCLFKVVGGGIAKTDEYTLYPWDAVPGEFYPYSVVNAPCKKGSKKGENVNYFYCEGMYTIIKELDSTGNILSSKKPLVKLVVHNSKIIDSICDFD